MAHFYTLWVYRAGLPCLSLWENYNHKALSVTCGDSSPKGRTKPISFHKKWSVSMPIRSTNCFTNTCLKAERLNHAFSSIARAI